MTHVANNSAIFHSIQAVASNYFLVTWKQIGRQWNVCRSLSSHRASPSIFSCLIFTYVHIQTNTTELRHRTDLCNWWRCRRFWSLRSIAQPAVRPCWNASGLRYEQGTREGCWPANKNQTANLLTMPAVRISDLFRWHTPPLRVLSAPSKRLCRLRRNRKQRLAFLRTLCRSCAWDCKVACLRQSVAHRKNKTASRPSNANQTKACVSLQGRLIAMHLTDLNWCLRR